MVFFILSDDLTGAAGVASMVDHQTAVSVNMARFDRGLTESSCIVLNLEVRQTGEALAARRLSSAMDAVGGSPVALRIDSALRGHVRMLVEAMLQRGDVMVTDTIPDYGRRTITGKTVMGAQERDIGSLLAPLRTRRKDREIVIADSETYDDLDRLARSCTEKGLIPIDPGPLVARVVRMKLGISKRASGRTRKEVSSVAFVIGTRDPKTLEQIRYMKDLGFPPEKPAVKRAGSVDVFSFSMEKDRHTISRPFLEHLTGYDALVLSGGATANYILERSDFRYLESDGQVQPLISSSTVKGGLFDGKRVVLKGGFIGDEKTYKTISDWLRKG